MQSYLVNLIHTPLPILRWEAWAMERRWAILFAVMAFGLGILVASLVIAYLR